MSTAALPSLISRADLAGLGLSRHRLYAMARAGELELIAPGCFARPRELDDTTASWASISLQKPSATICLLSVLSLHELTDEIPQETDIAVPRVRGRWRPGPHRSAGILSIARHSISAGPSTG